MILNTYPQAVIKFEHWKKYIVPILETPSISSVVFYYLDLEQKKVRLRTSINGFVIIAWVNWQEIVEFYKDKEVEVSMDNEIPDISTSPLLNKFNADFLDGRGMPEQEE